MDAQIAVRLTAGSRNGRRPLRRCSVSVWLYALGLLAAGCSGSGLRQTGPATHAAPNAQRESAANPGAAGSTPPRMYSQFGHVFDIYSVAVSPDNRLLLSGSRDESIRLWELRTGILLHSFDAGSDVRSVQFSPDGKRAIAGDSRGRVSVWDLESRNKLITFDTRKGSIQAEAFGVFPDGLRVVTGHSGNNLHVWDLETGRQLQALGGDEIRYHKDPSHVRAQADSQAILADGRHVFGGYRSGQIKLWEAGTGALLWSTDAHPGPVNSLRISKDGTFLYSASSDGLKQWHIGQRRLVRHYSDLQRVWVIDLAEDGRRALLALGGSGAFLPDDNRVALIDLDSGRTRSSNAMSSPHFSSAARITPDGTSIVAGDTQGNVSIWNGHDGELTQILRGSDGMLNDVAVSPTGLRIASVAMDNHVYLWDAEQIALTGVLRGHLHWPNTAMFSPLGDQLLTSARSQDFVRLWQLSSGKTIRTFDPGGTAKPVNANAISFSPDGKRVVTCNVLGELRVFDAADGRAVNSFRLGGSCDAMSLTRDGQRALVALDAAVHVFSLSDGTRLAKIGLPTNGIDEIAVSPDGVHVAIALGKGVHLLDLDRAQLTRSFAHSYYEAATFSPDARLLAAASTDRTINVWEVQTGRAVASFRGHTGEVTSLHFSANGRQLISAAKDGTTKIWNRETGDAVTLLVRDGEWMAYSDDGYFDASRRGGELAAIVSGMRGFRIDQLAARNNRPDILLDRIGISNPPLRAHFQTLYQQRLRKLGLDEAALSASYQKAPLAKLLRVDRREKRATIRFDVSDPSHELVSYNVYVNDVPIHGARGKPIRGNSHTIEEQVELTSGRNKIEISALNRVGVESLRDGQVVSYAPSVQADLYYLGFGVSDYEDRSLSLKYAAKDATDLDALVRSAKGFRNVYTKTYVNAQVTLENIRRAKEFFSKAGVDDTVVLFVAGHGLYGGKDAANYYYLTYNSAISRLEHTAANFESFENLLQAIAPRRKLFLMDTCQSGEANDELVSSMAGADSQQRLQSRGFRLKDTPSGRAGMPLLGLGGDRSRFIYNDVLRRSGAIVLSSSRGSELSYERDDLRNGIFTEIVIQALSSEESDANRDGRISTDELRDFVMTRVPRLSNGLQHPVVDRDNLELLFTLPMMLRVE